VTRTRAIAPALAAGVAAIVVVGVVVVTRDGEDAPSNAHAMVGRVDPDDMDRILRAADATTASTPQAELVAQGRQLFRSTELARRGESCQTCHTEGGGANPALGTITHPQVAGDFVGPRDPPSLWGVADTAPYGWAGQTPDLRPFVVGTIVSHFRNGDRQAADTTARQAGALVAYLETLDPPSSPFDQGTLSPAARRGEDLFQGKGGCMGCHPGPLLTDNALHDTRVPQAPGDNDPGAATDGPLANAFNTPQLRDVRNTAPYMHNGAIATLREVVEFYDRDSSVAPLDLTEDEVLELVAYLESL